MSALYDVQLRDNELQQRAAFVAAALTWENTPYHNHGRIKGAGCDCATLLVCAAQEAGLLAPDFDAGDYSPQWNLNRTAQTYLATIGKVCVEVPPPALPGDIIVWQFGHTYSHGAIVIEWPMVIHAARHLRKVSRENLDNAHWLMFVGEGDGRARPYKLMSLWPR